MKKNNILIFAYVIVLAIVLLLGMVFKYDIPQPYRMILHIVVIAMAVFFIVKGLRKKKDKHET